jgi:hypothetical protein
MTESFPTDPEWVGNIDVSDLIIYRYNYAVLFYRAFPVFYSYAELGYIEDISS